jgi:hypothetical protein
MRRQRMSLNTFFRFWQPRLVSPRSGGKDPGIGLTCQTVSDSPVCYLGIMGGRVGTFYLPVLPLYGFTKLFTNPFSIFYLLLNFKLPVLVLIWVLEQKKSKSVFPQSTLSFLVTVFPILGNHTKIQTLTALKDGHPMIHTAEHATLKNPTQMQNNHCVWRRACNNAQPLPDKIGNDRAQSRKMMSITWRKWLGRWKTPSLL